MMLFVYGDLMPVRLLEEILFWKMQEKEHTLVIRQIVPNLEAEYVKLLQDWESVFARTEAVAQQWLEAAIRANFSPNPALQTQVDVLLRTSLGQSQAFVQQLFMLLERSAAVKANHFARIVIQHIIRESNYFIGVLHAVASAGGEPVIHPSFGTETVAAPTVTAAEPGAGLGYRQRLEPEHDPQPASANGNGYDYEHEADTSSSMFEPILVAEAGMPDGQVIAAPDEFRVGVSQNSADEFQVDVSRLTRTSEGTWSDPLGSRKPVPIGGHVVPPLPYPYNALEPYIDEETMKLHHDKHHKSYVDGLNIAEKMMAEARAKNDFALIKHWEREAAFNGAGHYLHTIFWNIMTPKGGGKAMGAVAAQIDRDFESFDAFHHHFSQAAEKVEGGGWALLVWCPRSHRLEILQAEKHQNLSQWDVIPLLVLDVWEHAYYLKHQNNRAKYIADWWNVVNWAHVNERFAVAHTVKWTSY